MFINLHGMEKSCNNKPINSLTIPFLTYAAFNSKAALLFLTFFIFRNDYDTISISKGEFYTI